MRTKQDSTYSYGDSAGITPDFPFNDDLSSTKFGAKIDILPHCLQQFRDGGIFPARSFAVQQPGCTGRMIGNADMVKYVRDRRRDDGKTCPAQGPLGPEEGDAPAGQQDRLAG